MKIKTTLVFLLTLFVLSTAFAQYEPYMQVGLPEGAKARFGTGGLIWFGHSIAYSPIVADSRLAVFGQIGIWLYDAETLQVQDLLPGPMSIVRSMSFSSDGDTLAAGLVDGTVDLWDVTTRTRRRTLKPPSTMAYSDESGTLRHPGTRKRRSISSVSFSPNTDILAVGINNGIIELWNTTTGELHKILDRHEDTINDTYINVSFSPDGTTLASARRYSHVHLWDVATGELRKILVKDVGWGLGVLNASFSPNGNTLATYNGTLHLWDVSTGELLKIFEKPPETRRPGNSGFSPDGSTIAAYDYYTLHLWDVATGTVQNSIKMPYAGVEGLSFSPDGSVLAVTYWGGEVFLFDIATGEPREILKGTSLNSISVISPDGSTLATGNLLWDISTGTLRNTLHEQIDRVRCASFSPDGSILATGSGQDVLIGPPISVSDNVLRLWAVATGTLRNTLKGHTRPIRSVSFSPDGSTIASGSVYEPYPDPDPPSYVFSNPSTPDPKKGKGELLLWDVATGQEKNNFAKHVGNVYSVNFSPDGSLLATGNDDKVHLWDVATGELSNTFTDHVGNVYSLSFSPDGQTLASGGYDRTIRLWDVDTGTLNDSLKGHTDGAYSVIGPDGQTTDGVYSVGFSPDGQTLASGGQGGQVHLWDVTTGTLSSTLKGHVGDVYSLSFSPDGGLLATGSSDGTVLLWEIGPAGTPSQLTADINDDGVVNIQDLLRVASQFGQTGENIADVNGDGVVNIQDLVLVAAAFGAAPHIGMGKTKSVSP